MKPWKYKLENESKQLRSLIDKNEQTLDMIVSIYQQLKEILYE